jgi:hypothetical protein
MRVALVEPPDRPTGCFRVVTPDRQRVVGAIRLRQQIFVNIAPSTVEIAVNAFTIVVQSFALPIGNAQGVIVNAPCAHEKVEIVRRRTADTLICACLDELSR